MQEFLVVNFVLYPDGAPRIHIACVLGSAGVDSDRVAGPSGDNAFSTRVKGERL